MHRRISLAWTAIRGLVHFSRQRSIGSHISDDLKVGRPFLSVICLLGAAVCAVEVYLWRLWPEEWQAGLVFILFGSLVLATVTIEEIQSRRTALAQVPAATAEQCL
jgi:peptidoglycan/LPS O-acetylase OafA/YrhL